MLVKRDQNYHTAQLKQVERKLLTVTGNAFFNRENNEAPLFRRGWLRAANVRGDRRRTANSGKSGYLDSCPATVWSRPSEMNRVGLLFFWPSWDRALVIVPIEPEMHRPSSTEFWVDPGPGFGTGEPDRTFRLATIQWTLPDPTC